MRFIRKKNNSKFNIKYSYLGVKLTILDLNDVSKKFGTKVIFENLNFSLSSKERVAIIGKNGAGKSTLMKILASNLVPDSGKIVKKSGLNIQLFSQNPAFEPNLSIRDIFAIELGEIFSAIKDYEQISHQISQNPSNKALFALLDEKAKFIESKDGWHTQRKIEQILENFDLLKFDGTSVATLSGGEIRRAYLGALVLKKPDVLLLDEPTNHLDVNMVKFLQDLLLGANETIVFISHDRYFIDKVATRIVEIDDGKINFFDAGYANYLSKKQLMLENLAKSHETLLKQLKSEEEWLNRGVKARLKRNEGRKERIFKMREMAKKNPGLLKRANIELQRAFLDHKMPPNQNRQKMLFECKNIAKNFGSRTILRPFSVRVLNGEKIAIVGKNGCGKTTLLRILQGLEPFSSGEIKKGELKIGYFDQKREIIDENKTIIENFCPNGGEFIMYNGRNIHVYGYLKSFLFPKEFLTMSVGALSGGEKNRLALAKLFSADYECLLLDEPTNDLDIATINILEEYLLNFKGVLIFVSHDRYFVDKIATKLWIFEDGNIEQTNMAYSEILDFKSEINEAISLCSAKTAPQNEKIKPKNSQKLSYKQSQILALNPRKIELLERKIDEIKSLITSQNSYENLALLSKELDEKQAEISALEDEYLEVLEISENLK